MLRAVFDRFPDPLAVVERSRAVVAANRAFREVLGLPGDAVGASWCELAGCAGRAYGADPCPVDRAFASDAAIEETALTLPHGRGTVALTAIVLDPERTTVAVRLRRSAPILAGPGSGVRCGV